MNNTSSNSSIPYRSLAEGIVHGPYNSMYVDSPEEADLSVRERDYDAMTIEQVDMSVESRGQADKHGEAVELAAAQGFISADHNAFLIDMLDRWYFWPLIPQQQIMLTQHLSDAIARKQPK